MKKFVILSFLLISSLTALRAQETSTYFPYPTVPDSLTRLYDRADYLMAHFWDRCDIKSAFSSKAKMAQAFADFLSFAPLATADTAHYYVNRFIKKLEKQPDDLLFITQVAEGNLIGDSAQFVCEELYIPFASAVVANKKIDKTTKLPYAHQVKVIGGTLEGKKAPDLPYVDRNGLKRNLDSDTAQVVLIYFNDPQCEDCHLARIRLDANIRSTQLIKEGILKIVCITPGEADEQWLKDVASYPQSWSVGAAPDADEIYDIRTIPTFYFLDSDRIIRAKNLDIEKTLKVINAL